MGRWWTTHSIWWKTLALKGTLIKFTKASWMRSDLNYKKGRAQARRRSLKKMLLSRKSKRKKLTIWRLGLQLLKCDIVYIISYNNKTKLKNTSLGLRANGALCAMSLANRTLAKVHNRLQPVRPLDQIRLPYRHTWFEFEQIINTTFFLLIITFLRLTS